MRISDADRHQVAEILRQAAGEGRIDIDELDERLEATYAARTYADLVPITARPAGPAASRTTRPPAQPVAVGAGTRYETSRRDPERRSTARASGWSPRRTSARSR